MLDAYDEFFRRFLLDRKEKLPKVIADAEQLGYPVGDYTAELEQVKRTLAALERLEALQKYMGQLKELGCGVPQKMRTDMLLEMERVLPCREMYDAQMRASKLRPKPCAVWVDFIVLGLLKMMICILVAGCAYHYVVSKLLA
jgi:hypothetical protein